MNVYRGALRLKLKLNPMFFSYGLLTSSSSFILPGQVLGKYSYLSSSMRGILVVLVVVSLPHWGVGLHRTNVQ